MSDFEITREIITCFNKGSELTVADGPTPIVEKLRF